MSSNYSLQIISHLPDFNNKSLKKYNLNGQETVGVYGNEPFSIKFTNHTSSKLQVKLSLDGIDLISGDLASTDITPKMWVVQPYANLILKAFPETHNGGAGFVFTSAPNSVAAHLHGDMSSQGIIAAAVYTESYVSPYISPPIYICHGCISGCFYCRRNIWWHSYPYGTTIYPYVYGGSTISQETSIGTTTIMGSGEWQNYSITMNGTASNSVSTCSTANVSSNDLTLNSQAAVGAGQFTEQQITQTAGLIKPALSEIIRLGYCWWNELKAALENQNAALPSTGGFPASKTRYFDLGSTPRLDVIPAVKVAPSPVYDRV